MKILFVTYDFPYPTNSGGKNRAFHLLKHTSKQVDIYLFSFVREDYDPECNKEILSLGVRKIKVYKRHGKVSLSSASSIFLSNNSIFKNLYYDKKAEEMLLSYVVDEKIDAVHFESTYTGFYINETFKNHKVKTILGTENIEHLLYEDLAKNTKRILLKPIIRNQAKRLRREELEMVRNATAVTTITRGESEVLEKETGKESFIVSNGIEPDKFFYKFDNKKKNNILFVGNFSYFPNIEGINYFLEEVFRKIPQDIKLTIIGKDSSKVIKDNPRIVKKEFVEDIIAEYREADAMIFPIRIGGGTNFKILEAMALGLPVIAEPDRLSGLRAVSDVHFLSAHSPDEYKNQLERIYNDNKIKKITENARKLIINNYSWDTIGKDLVNVWKKVVL